MKIGQLVYVVKDGKAICAIITNRKRIKRANPNIRTLFTYFSNTISCKLPLEYEVTYNDNTREIVQREQLEIY
jgi:hypothetical protein